jgi:hypothetical protein
MKVLVTMGISMFIKKKEVNRREREINNDWLYMNRKKREMFNLSFFSLSLSFSVRGSLRVFLTLR